MPEHPAPDHSINPDHPERDSERGTGGLMPGNYEQAGGEAGHGAGEGNPAVERVRGPASKVPNPPPRDGGR